MLDRLALVGIFLLLSSESFLATMVGPSAASAVITLVLAALAYRTILIRVPLSADYRVHAATVLGLAMRKRAHFLLFATFALMFLWSFMRAALIGTLTGGAAAQLLVRWSSVLILLFATLVNEERHDLRGGLLRSLTVAFLAYAAVNVLFYIAGIRNEVSSGQYISVGERGIMFGLLGLDVARAPVPIGGGIQTGGLQSAAGIAMGLIMLRRAGALGVSRLAAFLLAACSAFLVLLTDSRGAMVAALAGGAFALLVPSRIRRNSQWLALAIPILPFIAMAVLALVGNVSWIGRLSRVEGTSSVDLLSGRPVIWSIVIAFLTDFRMAHLIGYGARGQVGSGVSFQYGELFKTMYAEPQYMSAHSTLLQTILDIGYIGLVVQTALFWLLLRQFGTASRTATGPAAWDVLGLGLTVFLVVLGTADQTLNSQAPNTMFLFLALNAYALVRSANNSSQPAIADKTR